MKVYVPMIFSAPDSVLSDRGRGCYQPIISFRLDDQALSLSRWRYWLASQKPRKKRKSKP